MSDRITTFEAAIQEMLRWANGEKSHWNQFANYRADDPAASVAIAECARADAAEVLKWSAVASALHGVEPKREDGDSVM